MKQGKSTTNRDKLLKASAWIAKKVSSVSFTAKEAEKVYGTDDTPVARRTNQSKG